MLGIKQQKLFYGEKACRIFLGPPDDTHLPTRIHWKYKPEPPCPGSAVLRSDLVHPGSAELHL